MQAKSPNPGMFLRLAAYLALQAAVLGGYADLVMRAGQGRLGDWKVNDLLRENRALEWVQIGILAAVLAISLPAFARGGSVISRLLACCASLALFRELDTFMRDYVFDRAHYIPMFGSAVAFIAAAAWERVALARELPEFARSPAAFLIYFGVMLLAVYSQILGQRDIWDVFIHDDSTPAKRFIEEGLEFMGYLVIACGVFEARFFGARSAPRDA